MRVALVAEETVHGEGGEAAARLQAVADGLAGRGHDVAVITNRWWEGAEVWAFEHDRIEYRAVADDDTGWRFAAQVPARLRGFDPDVIHAAHEPPQAVLGAKLASAITRTPLLVDWYDHRTGRSGQVSRYAARLPDAAVVPSRLVRTEVRELGRPPEAVDVIPNGIDMTAIRETEPEPIADVVFARRLDGEAYLDSLLLALAELRDVDWDAVVIGDGPARAAYEEQAADLRIDDRVTFLGEQPEARRVAVYKGAHVFVHTARYTPFATELLRAMAAGCVGIAEYHAESSAHELIEHRERGFRVTSESELADAIRSAADLERLDVDEDFASFDEREVLERYLQRYRDLQAAYGLI